MTQIDDFEDWTAWSEQAITNPPTPPSGFVLIECDAEPRHWPLYTVEDTYGYPAPCMYCAYDALAKAHDGCAHSHHRAWRRWRITHWIAGQLYVSGLTSNGGGMRWGHGCDHCQTMPTWTRTRRVYVLWVPLDTWRCLLKGHHLPGDPIAFGFCSKCLPCPECGSRTAGHEPGCAA